MVSLELDFNEQNYILRRKVNKNHNAQEKIYCQFLNLNVKKQNDRKKIYTFSQVIKVH